MLRGRRSALWTIAGGVALVLPMRRALAAGPSATLEVPNDSDAVIWRIGRAALADQRVFNLRTAKAPRYRALCRSEDGCARAVDWARQNEVPFSVLSGGHCFEGLSQSEHLVIDLRYLNKTEPGAENTIEVGPGATLGDVNTATAPFGLALPAGYCQTVGVGGHIGGGGLGILSRAFGLACDHLESARILTAGGAILTVSRDQNPDIFWALRGGGSGSFGIVTSSTFRLHFVPQATFVEFHWILNVRDAATFLSDWQALNMALDRRVSCFLFAKSQKPGHVLIRVRMISIAGSAVSTRASDQLNQLAPTLTEAAFFHGSFLEIADLMWPRTFNPKENTKIVSNFLGPPSRTEIWQNVLSMLDMHRGFDHKLSIEVLGGAIDDPAREETAYIHRREPCFLAQFGASMQPDRDNGQVVATLRQVQNQLKPAAIAGTYVSYPDLDLVDWPTEYWGANHARLVRVKTRHDPENLFRHAQSVRL